jgi:sugar phosphate isomerase/epimerase
MRLGIFAKTFARPSVREVFEAVKNHGFDCLQFNFSCAGLPTLPDKIDLELVHQIRTELERCSLQMAAVSGTCNLIHPDAGIRSKDVARLQNLIRVCPELKCGIVTLCTGTRDQEDIWRAHPANDSKEAWQDVVKSLERLLPVAESAGVVLGIEPEPANVINLAAKARRLLDELGSQCVKIVFDAANLLQPSTVKNQSEILSQAAELLGPDIAIAHGKELRKESASGPVAPGRGELDYSLYFSLLRQAGFDGPFILHNVSEEEVPDALKFLQSRLQSSHAVF